ncbi:hypothetical protein GLOIN_2v1800431 [Rhizophagus irregularis DAOM 181602=DAOM 197198]|uniref:Uncharacterized protein n=1 Tax=Rhizophagus irregularis (strain DAOM 181602 / DAOM 197198 / MUCL 43194) TaxID=747089 RepID=A0A2P4QSA8_RHIID|nr:hypothetical protein GLOIN_2v1800431 [Rhizophagus irregularis DAOM 181602=DAOM 197198]POG80510.1 hypothetical protein GLOIN_2v1800431 [Rhizophagus irregularis DAOM 181602=DAOM 197198]|eukprot:XP_025187376.1 hypothetical protein GLOIN_2v1800431 [Rhizophagus irregularis DAOM 181602=DAOM 197198]
MNSYPGQDTLISYLKKQNNKSYRGFLILHKNIVVASVTSDLKWNDLDNAWAGNYIREAEKIFVDQQLNIERLEYKKEFKSFWKIVIQENHEKENLTPKTKLLTEDLPQSSQVDHKKIKSIKKNDDDNTSNLLIELKEKQNQNEDHYLSKQNENPKVNHKKINKIIKRNNEEVTDDDPFINLKKRQRQNEDYIGLAYKDLVSVNKGYGKFGFLDVFVLGECYTNIELKYIPLTGLVSNTDGKYFDANELGELDKVIEREDEDILLRRQYRYFDKKSNKYICTTINDILNNGAKQLERYMRIIAKGQANKYSTGVCDERIKIINSNPNKLIGFVIVVIGFRRIIWRSVDEKLTTNYRYIKIN